MRKFNAKKIEASVKTLRTRMNKKSRKTTQGDLSALAPPRGSEPRTQWLTATCSAS